MLKSLNKRACRLAADGIRSPSCDCYAMTQQLHARAYLCHVIRRANSWEEVFDPISANRYTLFANEEVFIAADLSAGLVFSVIAGWYLRNGLATFRLHLEVDDCNPAPAGFFLCLGYSTAVMY